MNIVNIKQAGDEPLRVLIVDDNIDSAELLAELLETYHLNSQVAHTGAEALTTATRFLPQVVLLDIGLPDIDGLEVGRRLRAGNQDLTLIALTGFGQERDRAESQSAGFNGHMVKPVNIQALMRMLRNVKSPSKSIS